VIESIHGHKKRSGIGAYYIGRGKTAAGKGVSFVPGVKIVNDLPGIVTCTKLAKIAFRFGFIGSENGKFIFAVRLKAFKGNQGPSSFYCYRGIVRCPLAVTDAVFRVRAAIVKPLEGTVLPSRFNMAYIRMLPFVHFI
jgi:hypothetical protein